MSIGRARGDSGRGPRAARFTPGARTDVRRAARTAVAPGTGAGAWCPIPVSPRSSFRAAGLLLGLLGCKAKSPAVAPLPALPANARVSMSRTMCMGACPVYDLEIRGDGRVLFTGVMHVRVRDGHQTKQVSKDAVARLFDEFQRAGFFSWEDRYETPATDLPTVITSVTIGSLSKEIADYGPDDDATNEPDRAVREKLAALEHRVDAVAGADEWARCPDEEDGRCHTP